MGKMFHVFDHLEPLGHTQQSINFLCKWKISYETGKQLQTDERTNRVLLSVLSMIMNVLFFIVLSMIMNVLLSVLSMIMNVPSSTQHQDSTQEAG